MGKLRQGVQAYWDNNIKSQVSACNSRPCGCMTVPLRLRRTGLMLLFRLPWLKVASPTYCGLRLLKRQTLSVAPPSYKGGTTLPLAFMLTLTLTLTLQ